MTPLIAEQEVLLPLQAGGRSWVGRRGCTCFSLPPPSLPGLGLLLWVWGCREHLFSLAEDPEPTNGARGMEHSRKAVYFLSLFSTPNETWDEYLFLAKCRGSLATRGLICRIPDSPWGSEERGQQPPPSSLSAVMCGEMKRRILTALTGNVCWRVSALALAGQSASRTSPACKLPASPGISLPDFVQNALPLVT